jgi:hypothetical protein
MPLAPQAPTDGGYPLTPLSGYNAFNRLIGDYMQILAMEREKPGTQPDQYAQHLKTEAMRVWSLYQAGVVRELYFRQDRPEAVLMLECQDAAAARQILATLPFVQSGLIEFDVIPLVPYPGFSRLFSGQPATSA